eukprot:TRINITY_DN3283_c2_g1_i1.p1 TRINITY_DN3283_c2_g1~~TRINITY_DN3283_c2_g1_i1.p1  ORF type:complete len:1154 (+),score=496.74 TRINITY_DN3283_c2_g1_i1:168-3629(+)
MVLPAPAGGMVHPAGAAVHDSRSVSGGSDGAGRRPGELTAQPQSPPRPRTAVSSLVQGQLLAPSAGADAPDDPQPKLRSAAVAVWQREPAAKVSGAGRTAAPHSARFTASPHSLSGSRSRTPVGQGTRPQPPRTGAGPRSTSPRAGVTRTSGSRTTPTRRSSHQQAAVGTPNRTRTGAATRLQRTTSHVSPPRRADFPSAHTLTPQNVRRRYPRPTRGQVVRGTGLVASAAGTVTAMCAAESTVWCAEETGALVIREKDGAVCGIVDRPAGAPAVTALCYVPGSASSARIVVGHSDGTLVAVDAAKGERRSADVAAHASEVTVLGVTGPCSAAAVVSAGQDGAVYLFDPFGIDAPVALGRHAAAVRSVACGARRVYSAGDDCHVRLWDPSGSGSGSGSGQGSAELSTNVDDRVTDLLLHGRYLWVALQRGAVLVMDTAQLCTVAALGADTAAAAPEPRLAQCGQHVWAFAGAGGPLRLWHTQTLEPAHVPAGAPSSTGPVRCCLRVPTVPEDSELWSSSCSSVELWRDFEYVLPLWCCDYADGAEARDAEQVAEIDRLKRELSDFRLKLRDVQDRLFVSDGARERVQVELTAAKRDGMREAAQEGERRKRADAQLGELRQMILSAHRHLHPDRPHQVHASQPDLRAAVTALVSLAERGQRAGEHARAADAEQAHQLDALRAENGRLRREVDDALRRAELAGAEAQCIAADEQREYDALRASVEQMTEQTGSLEHRLRQALTRVAGLEAERTELAAEAAAARARAEELAESGGSAEVAELRRVRAELLAVQADLRDELSEARLAQPRIGELARPSAAAAAAASAAAIVSELKERLADAERDAAATEADLRSAVAAQTEARAAAERSCDVMRQQLDDAAEVQRRDHTALADLNRQLLAAQSRCGELAAEAEARDEEQLRQLQQQQQQQERDTGALRTELESERGDAEELRQRLHSAEAGLARAAELQTELERAERAEEDARSELKAARESLPSEEDREEVKALRSRLAGAEARGSMMEDEISELVRRKETLEEETASLRAGSAEQRLADLTEESQFAREEAAQFRKRAEELQRVIAELKAAAGETPTELQDRVEKLEKDKRRLQDERGRMNVILGKLRASQMTTNKELQALGSQLDERDKYIKLLEARRGVQLEG